MEIHPCWIHQSYQFSEPSHWRMMHKNSSINSWETTKVLLTSIYKFDLNWNEYGACDYRFDTHDGQVYFARNKLMVLSSSPNHGPFDT